MKMGDVSTVYGQLGGWRSRTTVVLALAAAAVGLGNFWRFPYLLGEHGGGPFMLAYVICLFTIAVPILIAEVLVGHHGRGNPVAALRNAADRSLRTRVWSWLGGLSCITGFLLLGYYLVVAGWALAYVQKMQLGVFSDASAMMAAEHFDQFLSSERALVFWQTLLLMVAGLISASGMRRGLGLIFWLSIPAVIVILAVLIAFSLEYGNLQLTREFLFDINWVDFSPGTWLIAAGQAFYTLCIGVGVGIAFGAYAPARMPIGRVVVAVAIFDVAVALAAGLVVFPILFANNMLPASGPGLAFITVPYAFGNMILGELVGTLFFTLLVVVSLASIVAIMEPIVGLLRQQLRFSRMSAVALLVALLWLLAYVVAHSIAGEGVDGLFQALSRLTAELLMPVVALLSILFVGWGMRPELLRVELVRESSLFFWLWLTLLRYIAAPVLLVLFFIRYL